jgi:hypothetical protein
MTRVRAVRPGTPPRLTVAELRRLAKRHAARTPAGGQGAATGRNPDAGEGPAPTRASDAQNASPPISTKRRKG